MASMTMEMRKTEAMAATATAIKVRESVRKYEALVDSAFATALEPRAEEEVSIETNARFPVRDLRLIFERAEGPLGIRDSSSAVEEKERATCQPLGFAVYGPTATVSATAVASTTNTLVTAPATTTATTTATITPQQSAAIRATTVGKVPMPPPPKAPRTLHPLACGPHGTAPATTATTTDPVQAGATSTLSTAYAAYVKRLVAAKKTDVAVASARVGLRVQQLEKAVTSMDDSPLESTMCALVLDASFLGHTAHHHVLLFSKELERASKWVRDADTRAAAMTSRLAACEREVAMLRQSLAVAQQENVQQEKEKAIEMEEATASATASMMASAPTTVGETNDQEKDSDKTSVAIATTIVASQDPKAGTSGTVKDADAENKNINKDDEELEDDDDCSAVIEYKRRWAMLHDLQRKQRVELETILAKARAMTESVASVESFESAECVNADDDLFHTVDCDGAVVMKNPESYDKSIYEDSSASHRGANEQIADTNMAVPALAPPPRPPSAPSKSARHIVQPKIHVARRHIGANMVKPISATHYTPSPSASPSRRALLGPGWALGGVHPVLPRTRPTATATAGATTTTPTGTTSGTATPASSSAGTLTASATTAPQARANGRPASTASKNAKTKAKPVQPRPWRS